MKLIYKIVTVFLLSTMIVMGTKFNAQTLVSNKSDDNIWFSMKIYGEQTNSWTDARWRQTDSVDNKWKVDFQNSNEEGAEYTITTFWLEHTNGTNVSDAHDVKEVLVLITIPQERVQMKAMSDLLQKIMTSILILIQYLDIGMKKHGKYKKTNLFRFVFGG